MTKTTIEVLDKGKVLKISSKHKFDDVPESASYMMMARRYCRKASLFADSMAMIINEVKGGKTLLETILVVNNLVTEGYFTEENYEELIEVLITAFSNKKVIKFVVNLVESNYDINIENEVETATLSTNILQFTNSYAKRLMAVGFLTRILVPVLSNFATRLEIKDTNVLFMDTISSILELFNFDDNGERIDLGAKLQRFVQVQVQNTLYSDKVIWSYLLNTSIDENTLTRDICRELFTNLLPKLELNKSPVSFFHVVIRQKIEYQFSEKFKHSYQRLRSIQTNENSTNPFIRVEQRLLKTAPELDRSIIHADMRKFISANNKLTDDDLNYHSRNIVVQNAQVTILNFFLLKTVGKINVYSLTKKEYIQLLFIAKAWFESNYPNIAFIILGVPVEKKRYCRKNVFRGKSLLEVVNSTYFKQLHTNYEQMGDKIDQTVMINILARIINTDWEGYTMPDGSIYMPTEVSIKSITMEVLRFIESL